MGEEPGLQQFGEGAETPPHHYFSPILIPKRPKTLFYQEPHQSTAHASYPGIYWPGTSLNYGIQGETAQCNDQTLSLADPSLNPVTGSLAIIKAHFLFQAGKEEQENNLSTLQTLLKMQFPPCRSCSTTA